MKFFINVEILSDEMRRSKRNDDMKLHGPRLPKNQLDLQNKKKILPLASVEIGWLLFILIWRD